MDENKITDMIAKARARSRRAADMYELSGNKFDYFDKAYYLGRAHSLEEMLDHEADEPEEKRI